MGVLLGRLIPTGDSIAVIEGGKVGGSCINYGCTPTKTLVASARAVHIAGKGDEFGFRTADPVKLDYSRIRERMNAIRNQSRNGLNKWMESTDNVTLIRGWGSFEDNKTIKVGGRRIRGNRIYVNTGTRASKPEIEGLDQVPWMDSAGILDLKSLPDHLLILGGGYIGVEFAQIYRRFGVKVTIVQYDKQIMPKEDEEVSTAIKEILKEEGIQILCNSQAISVVHEAGKIKLTIETEGKADVITGSHLLVATGRIPNTDKLNLESAGIKVDKKGYILVNDYCQTSVENVFAVGDVNGKGAFTHTSVNDAEIVLDHIFGGKRSLSDRIPIYGLFTDPPLGRVGMTEKEALSKGFQILKATRSMDKISRAKEMSETKGFAKLIVDAKSDLILGASILGPGGDEIINMFAAIMHSQIPCREFRRVVLIHPTVSELMPWVLDGLKEVSE